MYVYFQAKGGQTNVQFLKEILREIQMTNVPPYMFKQWASETYKSPTDYWMLRKIVITIIHNFIRY